MVRLVTTKPARNTPGGRTPVISASYQSTSSATHRFFGVGQRPRSPPAFRLRRRGIHESKTLLSAHGARARSPAHDLLVVCCLGGRSGRGRNFHELSSSGVGDPRSSADRNPPRVRNLAGS